MSEITWEQLTEVQKSTLKAVNAIYPEWAQDPIASEETWKGLHKWGLIWWDSFKHQILITDAGRAVLAQAQADPLQLSPAAEAQLTKMGLSQAGQPGAEGEGVIDPVEAMRLRAEDAIAARLKAEDERDTLQGVQQIAVDNYNAIWLMVRGNKVGEWDYPAQVTRYVEYMRDELAASLEREKALREALEGCIADCSLSAIYVGDFYRDATKHVKHRAAEALAANDGGEGGA